MKKYNIGQCAKVSMTRVREHCNMPQYIGLVKKAIKNGEGFVMLQTVNEHTRMAMVSGNAYDHLLGDVQVPFEALIF